MRILAIGAHPDDVEYGCFGSLCKYETADIHYLILTSGSDSGNPQEREKEQLESASFLNAEVKFCRLRSAYLNNDSGRATINFIEESISSLKPDIIFSHSANDRHQDHRLVNFATVSACRFFQGELFFYEGYSSLKYFKPNVVYRIDGSFQKKIDVISKFKSQSNKFYMNPKVIESIAVFRAAQFGFLGKAEAFETGGIVR